MLVEESLRNLSGCSEILCGGTVETLLGKDGEYSPCPPMPSIMVCRVEREVTIERVTLRGGFMEIHLDLR
jgi:hypothetical protein